MKWRAPSCHADVEVLRQEGGHDHAHPIVDEPFGLQLAHARIDERITRSPIAPRGERLVAGARRSASMTEVFPRQLGASREKLWKKSRQHSCRTKAAPPHLSRNRVATSSAEIQPKCRYGEQRDVASIAIASRVSG